MRLIDCDALKEKTLAHGEKIAYVASFLWDIDDSPTIPAIPVEWIISWLNKRYRETQRDVSIADVLAAWKKEQEEQ